MQAMAEEHEAGITLGGERLADRFREIRQRQQSHENGKHRENGATCSCNVPFHVVISRALMSHFDAGPKWNRGLATLARALTLARLVGVGPFLWLLVSVHQGASPGARALLGLAYLFLALSDFFDGRLARRAGAATAFWARADVGADIFFNVCSLGAGAWLRLVGPWVPAGVALLGARFFVRIMREGASGGTLPEDRLGK